MKARAIATLVSSEMERPDCVEEYQISNIECSIDLYVLYIEREYTLDGLGVMPCESSLACGCYL